MSQKITVELKDGTVSQMLRKAFNVFLSFDKVAKFKRSDGWVVVVKGPLIELGNKVIIVCLLIAGHSFKVPCFK